MRQRLRIENLLFPGWVALLAILMVIGVVAAVIVFSQGLVVTNLTDMVPWGLWITIDLSAIALSAGAFTISAAVYLLKIKQLQPVARTAVFVGVIGYSVAMMMLLMDIGRPERFWHGFVFWNIHSPLWEVTMCVGLYFTVLILEVIPIFGRSTPIRRRWPRLSGKLAGVHRVAPFLAILGLCFSMLHQTSLGITYGVLQGRPIWHGSGPGVLFIVSAIVAGPALTVLLSKVSARLTPKASVNEVVLDRLSKFIGLALIAYLYLRFWDLLSMINASEPARAEGFNLLTKGSLSFNFWVGEMILGIVVPMIILLSGRLRRQPRLQMLALLLVVGGLVAYRWDINMVGQLIVLEALPHELAPRFTQYVPSLIEFAAGAGVIAYAVLAFTLGVRYLNVVDHGSAVVEEVPDGVSVRVSAVGD